MAWNMFLLEHWKNSDYFILSIKASGWRACCFQTLLKMERIGKGGGGSFSWGLFLCTAQTTCSISIYCDCVVI